MNTRKCVGFGPFYAPKYFFKRRSKSARQTDFFKISPKFSYLMLEFFNFNNLKLDNMAKEARRSKLKREVWPLNLKKSELCLGLVEALKSEIFIWKWISAQASTLGVFFSWCASGPGIPPTLDLEEGKAFYDIRNKIVRRLPSWQRSGIVLQQCLRLRHLIFVKLRFELV